MNKTWLLTAIVAVAAFPSVVLTFQRNTLQDLIPKGSSNLKSSSLTSSSLYQQQRPGLMRGNVGQYRYEASIGYGGYPLRAANFYLNNHPEVTGDEDYYWNTDYNGGKVYSSGLITGDFSVLLNPMFTFTFEMGYNHLWATLKPGTTGDYDLSANVVYLLPKVQFSYISNPFFKLYSSLGIGPGMYWNFGEESAYGGMAYNRSRLEVQFVPVGIQFGDEIFGFAEAGVGTLFMGYRVGLGFRF